jgi:GNAT superfamily N-acetyltransferase
MSLLVRPAAADDYALYVRLLPELKVDDPAPSYARWVSGFLPSVLVAELDGVAVGVCWWQRLRDDGYVRQIMVAPAARQRGVAVALLSEVATRLRAFGCKHWRLNVKPDNVAAIALYHRLGFQFLYHSTSFRVPWALVDRLTIGPVVRSTTCIETDEAVVESTFGLPFGKVQTARASQRLLLMLCAETELVGFASFDPHFPGAFPFRVIDKVYTRSLLEAFRPHSPPGIPFTHVVVEGDAGLAEQLRNAGAEIRMEFDHYVGEL